MTVGPSSARTGRSSARAASFCSALPSGPLRICSTWKRTKGTEPSTSVAHRLGAPLAHQVGRVAARRQCDHAQLEALPGRHPRRAQHGLAAGRVGVQRQRDHRGESRQLTHLLRGQRRAHDPDRVLEPGLMQREHVGVALGDHHPSLARRGDPRQVSPEELAPLVEHVALGCIEVLGLLVVAQRPGAEAQHAAAPVAEREDDPAPEAVIEPARALLRARRETGLPHLARRESTAHRTGDHLVPGARRVADAEASRARCAPARGRRGSRALATASSASHSTRA